jgi:HEAT repeat protein
MAITMTCPRCTHKNTFDETKANQQLHCRICHFAFPAAAAPPKAAAPQAVPPKAATPQPLSPKAVAPQAQSPKAAPPAALPVPTLVLEPEAAPDQLKAGPPPASRAADAPPPLQSSADSKRSSRRVPHADDDDLPRRSRRVQSRGGSSVYLWVLGGVAALLALGCCVATPVVYMMFLTGRQVAEVAAAVDAAAEAAQAQQPGPFNPPPAFNPPAFNPPPPRIPLDPQNPDHAAKALDMLPRGGDDFRDACRWLRQADPTHPSRDQIARQLDKLVEAQKQAQFPDDDFFESFFRWATRDNVETLIRMVQDTRFGGSPMQHRHRAMAVLGEMKEARAAEMILLRTADIHDQHAATRGLEVMGPAGQPALVKHMHDTNGTVRRIARDLLKRQGAKTDDQLTQTLADLDDRDEAVRNAAIEWLAQTPVEAQRQNDVARALEPLINGQSAQGPLLKAIAAWGTADTAVKLAKNLDAANPFRFVEQVRVVAKFKEPKTVPPLTAFVGKQGLHGLETENTLKEFGKAAEPDVVKLLGSPDSGVRTAACRLLGAIGTPAISMPALQRAAMLNQNDRLFVFQAQMAFKAIQARGK